MKNSNRGREELCKEITKHSNQYEFQRGAFKDIAMTVAQNADIGRVVGILNQSIPLDTVSEYDLFIVATAFNRYQQYAKKADKGDESKGEYDYRTELIKMSKYFTENEVKKYLEQRVDHDLDVVTEIVFENVDRIGEDRYISTSTPYSYIAKLQERGILEYNKKTQRNTRLEKHGGELIEMPTINKKAVKQIKEAMWAQMDSSSVVTPYVDADPITLNVRRVDGTEKAKIKYNEYERELTIILDGIHIDIIDGMHRITGMVGACGEMKGFDGHTLVNIFHYDQDEARKYIIQQSKRTAINKSYIKTLDSTDVRMTLAKDINNYGSRATNELYHRMGKTAHEVNMNQELALTFEMMATILKANFSSTDTPTYKLKKFIVDGMKHLRDAIQDVHGTTMPVTSGFVASKIALLSLIYGEENWQDTVYDLFNSDAFTVPSIDDEAWQQVGAFRTDIKLKAIYEIRDGVQNMFNNIMARLEETKR